MYFYAKFWSRFFEDSFSKQVQVFCDVLETRVLPVFSNAEAEAEEAAGREYERLGNLLTGEDGPILDMGDTAEMAREAGLAQYEMITATNQIFLNLAAAALYHMFEQQLLAFHRRQVLHPREKHDPKLSTKLEEFHKRLKAAGLDVEALPTWSVVKELKLAANAIKHGEGRTANELRTVRPQLCTPPVLHGTRFDRPIGTVSQPLAGQDVYITIEDIRRYRDALLLFWKDFGEAILENQLRDESA